MRSLFRDTQSFDQAVTHRTWAVERGGADNERLEFLGDAVLQICVSRLLYDRFQDAREGDLSRIRSQLVNTRRLAEIARRFGLPPQVRLGRGEEAGGGRDRDRLLAGAYEAVLGALYIDQGLEVALQHVASWIHDVVDEVKRVEGPKNRLQEWAQAQHKTTPVYEVESSEGPPHAPRFVVAVKVEGVVVGRGSGKSKQAASHAAAQAAMNVLEAVDGMPGGGVAGDRGAKG